MPLPPLPPLAAAAEAGLAPGCVQRIHDHLSGGLAPRLGLTLNHEWEQHRSEPVCSAACLPTRAATHPTRPALPPTASLALPCSSRALRCRCSWCSAHKPRMRAGGRWALGCSAGWLGGASHPTTACSCTAGTCHRRSALPCSRHSDPPDTCTAVGRSLTCMAPCMSRLPTRFPPLLAGPHGRGPLAERGAQHTAHAADLDASWRGAPGSRVCPLERGAHTCRLRLPVPSAEVGGGWVGGLCRWGRCAADEAGAAAARAGVECKWLAAL